MIPSDCRIQPSVCVQVRAYVAPPPLDLPLIATTMKCAQPLKPIAHRSSRAWPKTAPGFRQRVPFEIFATVSLSATHKWRPHFVPATHLGRRTGAAQSASTLRDLKNTRKRHCKSNMKNGDVWRTKNMLPSVFFNVFWDTETISLYCHLQNIFKPFVIRPSRYSDKMVAHPQNNFDVSEVKP